MNKTDLKQAKRRFKGKFLLAFIGIIIIPPMVVMFLWNALIPNLLLLPEISFWQSLGLLLLCRILFGGFGWRPLGHGHSHEHREELRKRWMEKTDEERQHFFGRRFNSCSIKTDSKETNSDNKLSEE